MGVRVFENEFYNTSDDDDECFSCTATNNATKSQEELQKTLNVNFSQHQNATKATNFLNSKDFVGNSKEFRIENNKCNLRIIGNSNRIRITNNFGNIQIIGNNTRLKINKNSGNIKYTGNEGRICLGSESTEQTVDYIGCNGLLKVINSMELYKSPRSKSASNASNNNTNKLAAKCASDKSKIFTGNATAQGKSPNPSSSSTAAATTKSTLKAKLKSASSDSINDFKNAQWQEFNNLMQHPGWQHFAKVSLPNLKDNLKVPDHKTANVCKCRKIKKEKAPNMGGSSSKIGLNSKQIHINNHTNIVNNFGDIIIKNSVNVSIA